MKIAEIKARIEKGDCSDETLDLFKAALKRVPADNRCQYCYITAVNMPHRWYKQAIEMIEYGLEEHCDDWFDRMRSYTNLAIILEKHGDYAGAKFAYSEAFSSVDSDKRSDYSDGYSADMMRMEMHISNFEYTEALEYYYNSAIRADEFNSSFQKTIFYRLLAEIIIFREKNDLSGAKKAFDSANEMLYPSFEGMLTRMLRRKGYIESAGATKEALAFLKRARRYL